MKITSILFLSLITAVLNAQSWVQVANIPTGRHHPITFTLEGKGYAVTGTRSNGQPTDDFYRYDPITDSWTTLADFPGAARSFGIGTVLNGMAYIGFGANNIQYLKDLWRFDPQTGQWTQLSSCSCSGRRHPAYIGIGNRIYVGLGDDSSGDLKDWWMYTIDTDTWTQIADLPGPQRHHPFHFNAGGEVFAGMGHGGPVIYKDWYKLDTATNSWTPMTNFPGEARVAGTQFDHNGFGYVLSGDGDNHSWMQTGEFWRYSPGADSWLQMPPHPGVSRWAPGNFVIGDVVYFFGGYNRTNLQYPNDMWQFNLAAHAVNIEENQMAAIAVYPNPAKNFIRWEGDESITRVVVLNALGQTLLITDSNTKYLNANTWESGLYFMQFFAGDKLIKTEKLTIRK